MPSSVFPSLSFKLEMSYVIETSGDHGHQRMNEEPRVVPLVKEVSLGWMSSLCPAWLLSVPGVGQWRGGVVCFLSPGAWSVAAPLTSAYLLGEGEFQDGSLDLHPWCRHSEPGVGGILLHG